MSRQTLSKIKVYFLIGGLLTCAPLEASPSLISWIAEGPENNMDTPTNWSPNTVPGGGNTAVFDSTLSNINKTPTEQNADFSVCAIQFLNQASPFVLTFENHALFLEGQGIIGTNTNAEINVTNSNNPVFMGNQIAFTRGGGASMGSAIINVSNTATQTGNISNNILGNLTNQFVSAGPFFMHSEGSLTVMNNGENSTIGTGNSYVGAVRGAQALFNNNFLMGDYGTVLISNQGSNSANGVLTNFTGYVIDQQLYVENQFEAGDSLNMTISNLGSDDSVGTGGGVTAMIDSNSGTTGNQAEFNNAFIVGNNANILAENLGIAAGTKTNQGARVASMNQGQMLFRGAFQAGDDLTLLALNIGTDSSQGVGSNSIGTVSSSQLKFDSELVVGDNANIAVGNGGEFSGSNTHMFNYAGAIGSRQFQATQNVHAGDFFTLYIENIGIHTSHGVGNDFVGVAMQGQVKFQDLLTMGDNANIFISNTGINSSTSQSNYVGYFGGPQLEVAGNFMAGNSLNMSITNTATNTGDINNYIGFVNGSQAVFQGTFSVGEGSFFSVSNNGTVGGAQIVLSNGFNILGGKATIQAINHGTVGGQGILIQGNNAGGNANIVLENTSLIIDTTLPTFTIGELNGDESSVVQSYAALIIDTDSSTNGLFSGVIQDFPTIASTLEKQGGGMQTLSGINTYTGLTSIQNGALSLTGSIAGDVAVNAGEFNLRGTIPSVGGALAVTGGTLSLENAVASYVGTNLNLGAGTTLQVDMGSNTISTGHITTGDVAVLNTNASVKVLNPPGSSAIIPLIISGGGAGCLNVIPVTGSTLLTHFSTRVTGATLELVTSFSPATIFATPHTEPVAAALGAVTGATGSLANLQNQLPLFTDADILNDGFETIEQPTMSGGALEQSFATALMVGDLINFRIHQRIQSQKLGLAMQEEQTGYAAGGIGLGQHSTWFKVFGQQANQDERDGIEGYKDNTWGIMIGVDRQFSSQTLLGASVNWAKANVHNKDSGSSTAIDSYQASVYGEYDFEGPVYFNGLASAAYNDYKTHHNILFGTVSLRPTGHFHGSQYGVAGEVGYDYPINGFHLIPLASLFYSHLDLQAYTETGADTANQQVAGTDFSMLLGGVGIRLTYDYSCQSVVYEPELHARVFYDFINDSMQATALFVGGGPSFSTIGLSPAPTSFNVGVSLATFSNNSDIVLSASYDFEYKNNYYANMGFLRVRYEW